MMKLLPSTSRIAPGSMSPRSGASRVPRRSFQYANNLRVGAVFTGQPCLILGSPAPPMSPIGTAARGFSPFDEEGAEAVPRAMCAARGGKVAVVSVKTRPRLAARRGAPSVPRDLKPGRREDVTKGGPTKPSLALSAAAFLRLLLRNVGGLHQHGIGRDVLTEERVELLDAHRHRLDAERHETPAHFGRLERLRGFPMKLLDDLARRLRRQV